MSRPRTVQDLSKTRSVREEEILFLYTSSLSLGLLAEPKDRTLVQGERHWDARAEEAGLDLRDSSERKPAGVVGRRNIIIPTIVEV